MYDLYEMANGFSFSIKWVTLVSAFALAGIAGAQTQTPIRLKLGLNSVTNSSATDQVRSGGYAIGLSYQIPQFVGNPIPARFFVDADYSQNSSGDRNLGIFSLGVSGLQTLGVPGNGGCFYGGLGVGVAFINGDRASRNPLGGGGGNGGGTGGGGGYNQTASSGSRVKDFGPNAIISDFKGSRLYGSFLLGYEFQQGIFLEARYRLVGTVDGINPSSFGFFVGYKF